MFSSPRTSFCSTVVAGRAKPQQSGQQSGCTALSGKQEGVREEGDGHRGAELGRRLSFSGSPLLPLHHPLFIIPVLLSLIFYLIKKKKKKQQLYQKNSSATLKKKRRRRRNIQRTTEPEWTLTCLPTHLRKTREGNQTFICFLSLILLFFYCMMWNKLLLTEFVIYLCLVGFGWTVSVSVLQIFFFFFPFLKFYFHFLFCNVRWCAHLDCLQGAGWWPNQHILKVTEEPPPKQKGFSEFQKNTWAAPAYLWYFKRLTDVTGCNSAKSPLHWWIMTPPLAKIFFYYYFLNNFLFSKVEDDRCWKRSVMRKSIFTLGRDRTRLGCRCQSRKQGQWETLYWFHPPPISWFEPVCFESEPMRWRVQLCVIIVHLWLK